MNHIVGNIHYSYVTNSLGLASKKYCDLTSISEGGAKVPSSCTIELMGISRARSSYEIRKYPLKREKINLKIMFAVINQREKKN